MITTEAQRACPSQFSFLSERMAVRGVHVESSTSGTNEAATVSIDNGSRFHDPERGIAIPTTIEIDQPKIVDRPASVCAWDSDVLARRSDLMPKRQDLQLIIGLRVEVCAEGQTNEINTSNMAAEAYAGAWLSFDDFNRDGNLLGITDGIVQSDEIAVVRRDVAGSDDIRRHAVVLLVAALDACYCPAQRAAAVDPSETLRAKATELQIIDNSQAESSSSRQKK